MKKREHIKWIDGIRGIACMGVAIHHFLLGFFPATYMGDVYPTKLNGIDTFFAESVLGVFFNGNFFVCVFCCLSGLVLAYAVMKLEDRERVSQIVFKRYLRLALPMFAITLIVTLMMHLYLFSNSGFSVYSGGAFIDEYYNKWIRWRDVFQIAFIGVWFEGNTIASPVFWMLSLLLDGSIFAIILSVLPWKMDKRFVLPVYSVIAVAFINKYAMCFVFGVILAYVMFEYKEQLQFKYHTLVGGVCVALGIFFGGYPTERVPANYYSVLMKIVPTFIDTSLFYHMVGAALLVIGVMMTSGVQKVLGAKALTFLGKISYAVFLVHMPIICSFSTSFFRWYFATNGNYAQSALLTLLLTTIIILLSATAFYYFIEVYCEKAINCCVRKIYSQNKKG